MQLDDATFFHQKVNKCIRNIILKYAFIDSIDMSAKLSEIVTFGDSDITLITQYINREFDIDFNQLAIDNHKSVSDMTINEICDIAFHCVMSDPQRQEKIRTKRKSYNGPTFKPKPADKNFIQKEGESKDSAPTWNRRKIFAYILKALTTTVDYNVKPTDVLWNLMQNVSTITGGSDKLYNTIHDLEKKFGIQIDLTQNISKIGDNAEKSLVAQGKAIDSRRTDESVDIFWYFLITTVNPNWLCSLINSTFKIDIPVYQMKNTKNYQEYVKLITDEIEKSKPINNPTPKQRGR